MSLDKFEIWVHDHILKNDTIRHAAYGAYQRALYVMSPKIKFEGSVETVTPDDGFEYLFGYYDKCPWSDDGNYLLALRVKNASTEADSAKPADIVRINLSTKEAEKIAVTHSWNVQQGCMAQWLSDGEILYNDFRDGKYCAVVLDLETKAERIIPMPVYAMSQDRKTALSLDFSRLHRLRPGYGYANIPDAFKDDKCPDSTCIWKIDIASGSVIPLLKYTDFAFFEPKESMTGAEHKINHLMISPDGNRFMVLHRWFQNGVKYTRLVTCGMDGSDMYNLSDDDFVSHCCWKNNEEILSYLNKNESGKGYYLMRDKTREYERCWEELAMDGHPTYSCDGQYVVTDTYPNRRRMQSLYIMHGSQVSKIAQVFSPFKYGGDTRCDLHPRWSKDGSYICFDASFSGKRSVCIVPTGIKPSEKNKTVLKPDEEPSVSVIIPCYNCEAYIDQTLKSLESQTCGDFEVICVDDGSSDHTREKLMQWQQKDVFRLRVICQENAGVSVARNRGIDEAHGKYLMFLDSDDVYHTEMIGTMLSGVTEYGADASYCMNSRKREDLANPGAASVVMQNQTEAMRNLLFRMGQLGLYNYIFNRRILAEKGIRFDEATKFGEDREFNWKYMCHCRSFAFFERVLYWYRVNPNSATKKKASWRKTDLLTAVKRIEAYLSEQDCAFSKEFNSYMYARAMWAVAKTFAVSGDRELFKRLRKEYPVRKCMKITAKDHNKLVAIASVCYLLQPGLFYKVVRLKK